MRCTSTKKLEDIVANITNGLLSLEKSILLLVTPLTTLNGSYRSYSARTARNGWQTIQQQCVTTGSLRREAQKLRSQIREFDQTVKNIFGPKIVLLQMPLLRLVTRDAPTKAQLAQNVNMYNRILELLQNMIKCPVNILQVLGEDSTQSDDSGEPF